MSIAIDIRNLEHPITGTQRYERCLLQQLAAIDQENRYLLLWRRSPTRVVAQHNFSYVRFPCGSFRFSVEQILLPIWLTAARIDVYHAPLLAPPKYFYGGKVMTIHDVIHERFSNMYTGDPITTYFLRYRRRALTWTDVVLCDSQATASDAAKLLGARPEQLRVVYLGVDDRFQHVSAAQVVDVRQRYSLPANYILSVASLDVRKNLSTLLQAYARLRADGFHDLGLVLVGKPGTRVEKLYQEIDRLDVRQHVRLTGHVPDADLPAIYAGAAAFAYPSLYEGFGLPPLEAMAAGVPVVVSNVSALPEVAGEAALYVSPHDVDGLAYQLRQILCDQCLRAELQRRGREHAQRFDWRRTAEQTLQAYIEAKAIASKRSRPISMLKSRIGTSFSQRGAGG